MKTKKLPATSSTTNDDATLLPKAIAAVIESPRLRYALDYAQKLGWAVFPCHTIIDGACSCGKTDCKSVGKHPMTKNGVLDATTNIKQITDWWTQNPHANIGVATGKSSGIVVIDVDINHTQNKYGDASLEQLEIDNKSKLPNDVYADTGGGGLHYVFEYPQGIEIKNSASRLGVNLDVRSDSGYIIVEPSLHISGNEYAWDSESDPLDGAIIPPMPQWLVDLVKTENRASVKNNANYNNSGSEWECLSDNTKNELIDALNHCPNELRDDWVRYGMALHATDSGETGFDLWTKWSETSPKYDAQNQAKIWTSFNNSKDLKLNKETIFYDARNSYGYNPEFKTTHYAANKSSLPEIIGKQIKKDGANQLIILGVDKTSCETIHFAFAEKYPVAVGIDNDGLKIVAAQLRETYPKLRIVVAGNSNAFDDYDTGRKKSQAACYNKNGLIGGIKFVTPNFKVITEAEVKTALETRQAGTTQTQVFEELRAERLKKYEITKPTPTTWNDLAEWAGIDAVKTQIEAVINRMGVIFCEGGEQPKILIEIEAEMNFDAANLFQRAGQLVRTIHIEKEFDQGGVKMPANTLTIHSINEAWLANYWTKIATWKKFDVRSQKYNRVDAPLKYATAYFSQVGDWNLRSLRGISECPTLRSDGTVILESGYDKLSGLMIDYRGAKVTVKDNPTRDDALAALAVLKQPFKDFKFLSPADLSVVLAAMLTAVVRPSVRTAPMFAYDAPVKGSGKTLLVDTVTMISTGRNAVIVSQGNDEAEDEKKLGALLMRGVSAFNLDNIERPITGDFINSLLTAESVSTRILGQSKVVDLQTSVTVLATGNNLSFGSDMTRRVLLCRLDPQCERPDALTFDVNLREFIPANRHLLLGAILTILRAYIVAGKPKQDISQYGSFEQWSDLIRSSLVWLGAADPCDTRARLESNDQSKESLNAVLALWFAAYQSQSKTAAEIAESCELSQHVDLKHALLEVAASNRGDSVDAKRLGRWIKKNLNRIVGDLRFEKSGQDGNSHKIFWKIAKNASNASNVCNRSDKSVSEKFSEALTVLVKE